MNFPQFLYRGDADLQSTRKLRSIWPGSAYGGLLTNLSNSGSGLEIFARPMIDLVNHHVAIGWSKTHFLSFSESRSRAMEFSSADTQKILEKVAPNEQWACSLITLEASRFIDRQTLAHGIFKCRYQGRIVGGDQFLSLPESILRALSNEVSQNSLIQILLINVVGFLHSIRGVELAEAIHKAEKDQEWLVLPLDPCTEVPGELTSKLDDGCISEFECFQFNVQA
ncbi:MAG: hypothetical protein Q7U82_14145 [Gammaproteobacteria bacterium]|nr:hypothetical protein [Gammaproteobacteria bacterium]